MNSPQAHLRRTDLFAIFLIFALPWILFLPATVGQGVFISGDASSFFFPQQLEYARALAEGRLPLWAPGMGAGFPAFAEGQLGGLYPPNLLLYRLLPITLAFSYSTLFHLSWAGIGMFLLCRSSGLSTSSATLGGWTFALSGFLLAHIIHLSLLLTASWLPWMIFLQHCYRQEPPGTRGRRLRFFLVSGAIGLELLSGFPQIAFLNLIAFSFVGVFDMLRSDRAHIDPRSLLRNLVETAIWVAFGFAFAAVQLLPTAELMQLSYRMYADQVHFSSYALNPTQLLQFLSPFASLGEPSKTNQEYWGFIGVTSFVLALLAVVLRRKVRTLALLAFGLVVLSLSFGSANPFYSLLFYVPIINHFRAPVRFLFLFTFVAAFLAAIGLDELERRLGNSASSSRWARRMGALFAVVIVGLIALKNISTGVWLEAAMVLPWLFLCAAAILVWAGLRQHFSRASVTSLLVSLSLLELTLNAMPFLFTLDVLAPPAELTRTPTVLSTMDRGDPYARIYVGGWVPDLLPNRMLVYGKQSPDSYSPLTLERNAEYEARLSPATLNLLGVRYLIHGTVGALNFADPGPVWVRPDYIQDGVDISPYETSQVDVVTFSKTTNTVPNGLLVGDVVLTFTNGESIKLPLRMGIETAEYNYDVLEAASELKHKRPSKALPLFFGSPGDEKAQQGTKFVAHYELPSQTPFYVDRVQVQSYLWSDALIVDDIQLIDKRGHSSSAASLAQLNDYRLVYFDYDMTMLENRDAMGRAFIVHAAQVMPDAEALDRLNDPTFHPDQVVLLSDGTPMDPSPAVDQGDMTEIMTYKPEQIIIKAQTPQSGYLVLTDTWYPGWIATVDDQPVPIVRADYIFRAIPIKPGIHTIVFQYQPASFAWGAAISALTALIACLVVSGLFSGKLVGH